MRAWFRLVRERNYRDPMSGVWVDSRKGFRSGPTKQTTNKNHNTSLAIQVSFRSTE